MMQAGYIGQEMKIVEYLSALKIASIRDTDGFIKKTKNDRLQRPETIQISRGSTKQQ